MTSRLPITLVDSNCRRPESSSEYGGHFVGRPFFIGKLFFFMFKNDEALVAEEMRRTTEAAAVSEDTMFEEQASDDGP